MKKPTAKMTTLVAVSSGLASLPAAALELGEARVSSTLGQPLRASIAYALAPSEELLASCVNVGGRAPSADLPGIGTANVTIANGVISITGESAIREPLVMMRINIRCPYTANITRDYMLFVDPPGTAAAATTTAPAASSASTVATRPTVAATPRRSAPAAPVTPIENATRYRVAPGDSLSQIASRIENRPVGLWDAVNQIFAANPHAFLNDDMNQLKAGVWLDIPDFGQGAPVTVADQPATASAPSTAATPAATVADVVEPSSGATTYDDTATTAAPAESAADQAETSVVDNTALDADATVADTDVLQPADAIVDYSEPETVIPDTELDGPVTTSESPNGNVAVVQTPTEPESSTNWLLWLAGAGAGLILLLLLFGRMVRSRFGASPIGAVDAPQRRRTDGDTQKVEALVVEESPVVVDEDPTEENLALDADLVVGTGLSEGTSVDVADDFGFAAPTEIDIELPEEMSSGTPSTGETDIIPPLNIDTDSILESEVMPEDELEDDDYDMSVIVDATKMPDPDEVTQRDIEAVAIDTSDETLITGDYTLSSEVDYNILEQDYEDELTATQALNEEINRAAAELAERMAEDSETDADDTAAMSRASITAIDMTAQLPANDDPDASDDDTQKTAVLNTEEPTVDLNAEEQTVEMQADDDTVEMPAKNARS